MFIDVNIDFEFYGLCLRKSSHFQIKFPIVHSIQYGIDVFEEIILNCLTTISFNIGMVVLVLGNVSWCVNVRGTWSNGSYNCFQSIYLYWNVHNDERKRDTRARERGEDWKRISNRPETSWILWIYANYKERQKPIQLSACLQRTMWYYFFFCLGYASRHTLENIVHERSSKRIKANLLAFRIRTYR